MLTNCREPHCVCFRHYLHDRSNMVSQCPACESGECPTASGKRSGNRQFVTNSLRHYLLNGWTVLEQRLQEVREGQRESTPQVEEFPSSPSSPKSSASTTYEDVSSSRLQGERVLCLLLYLAAACSQNMLDHAPLCVDRCLRRPTLLSRWDPTSQLVSRNQSLARWTGSLRRLYDILTRRFRNMK